jgi:hypothetical protein
MANRARENSHDVFAKMPAENSENKTEANQAPKLHGRTAMAELEEYEPRTENTALPLR